MLAPRRMYIQELQTSTENYVRIMATLVAIRSQILRIDDGTATLSVINNLPIKGAIGQTIDILCRRKGENFHAECIIWNVSPQNETLRRLELCYKGGELHFGYACPKISSSDVKRAVDYGEGVTVEDLVLLLNATQEQVQDCLQELQLSGEIYCNREGCYVPL